MPSLQLIRLMLAAAVCGSVTLELALTFRPNTINVSAKTQQDERKLENEIPKHVPLRIKIRKEKEFKDTKNENWAHDFELEVTNTGEKPIYEFYLDLILDVKDSTGQNVSAPVYYGRAELGDHRVKATESDLPLKPGESYVLKIHPGQLGAWDIIRRKESRPHPRTVRIKFVTLSFGDGTGLMGPDATPVPRKVAERSGLARCAPPNSRSGPGVFDRPVRARHNRSAQLLFGDSPAMLLPANFSFGSSESVIPVNSPPTLDECCPDGCAAIIVTVEQACYNCPQQNRIASTYCSNPDGACYSTNFGHG